MGIESNSWVLFDCVVEILLIKKKETPGDSR